ncbi:MAG: protein kinase, partial [Anaerolineae bacterium]|nr:protein kinase [Anaerolineae bacterium]
MAESLPARHAGGRYQLLDRLGAGGMGVVYRALDRLTGMHVALKRVILTADETPGADEVDTRLALAQEFQTLATLRHPHIISVLDYGFNAVGQPFFTMDLLDAPQTVIAAAWDKPLAAKIDRLVEMLQALAYLHRRGILHRDLKPANVLVVGDQVRLLDFGLSQDFAPEHSVVGTPAYMAPEILRGDRATPAADLYAVGVLAYELIAGRHPFDTSNVSRLIADVINTPPDLTRLAAGLARFPNADAPPASLPDAQPSTGTAADALEQTAGPGVLAAAAPTMAPQVGPDSPPASAPEVSPDDTTRVSPAAPPAQDH